MWLGGGDRAGVKEEASALRQYTYIPLVHPANIRLLGGGDWAGVKEEAAALRARAEAHTHPHGIQVTFHLPY
jgi:hypothetical protein